MLFEPVAFKESDASFLEHFPEDGFGSLWFRHPGEFLQVAVEIVVTAGAEVKLKSHAANHLPAAHIGAGEPAAHHAANVVTGLKQCGLEAVAGGGHRSGDTSGGAAVHDEVEVLLGQSRRCGHPEQDQ